MNVLRVGAILFLTAALFERPTQACYSGLVLIPTSDVTGAYTWAVDVQWQGYSHVLKTDQFIINTEFGLGDRFEAGIDADASSGDVDRRVLFNAKYVFLKNDRWRFALAGGVQNMTSTFTPHPYVVASKDWGVLRTHVGIQREPDGLGHHGFFGLDGTFGDHWQWMVDHTAGPDNYSSAGIGWSAGPWQVLLGGQWPNGGGTPVVVLHVVLTGSFRKR